MNNNSVIFEDARNVPKIFASKKDKIIYLFLQVIILINLRTTVLK